MIPGRAEYIVSLIRRAWAEGVHGAWELADRVMALWTSEAVPMFGPEPDEDEVFALVPVAERPDGGVGN